MASFNRHYRAALQPLLDRVCTLQGHNRRLWLDELRSECPVVTRDLEVLLRALQREVPTRSQRAADEPAPFPESPQALGLRG